MELKEILEQLKKEKDPLRYLKELLKKIKDRNLKLEIEKLIEKLEKKEAPRSLESAVESVSFKAPAVETETFEKYNPSRRLERASSLNISRDTDEKKPSESYGSNIKTSYIRNESEFRSNLESSGLISRTSFNTTAEAKEAIRQKGSDLTGNYDIKEEKIQYHSERDSFSRNDNVFGGFDLKESHKKKKNMGFYNG